MLEKLHKARMGGRKPRSRIVNLLEPTREHAAMAAYLGDLGMISLMLPLGMVYEMRGLLGLVVVLWARAEANPWVREVGPWVRQARASSCVVLSPPHSLSEIPLSAPAEVDVPFPPLEPKPAVPWWEIED